MSAKLFGRPRRPRSAVRLISRGWEAHYGYSQFAELFRRKPVVEMEAETWKRDRARASSLAPSGSSSWRCSALAQRSALVSSSCCRRRYLSAGPAVVLSFADRWLVAGLTAVCYAELAGAVPVSGSSYSYAYATIGELPAMAVAAACFSNMACPPPLSPSVGPSISMNCLDNLFGVQIPEVCPRRRSRAGSSTFPR